MTNFIKQIYNGKTLGRILFNRAVLKNCRELNGKVLDIAGGENPSYIKYLPENIELIRTDILDNGMRVDMNKPFPLKDEEFDGVLFLNAIYIAENPKALLKEIYRVLKKDGNVFIASPFIAPEMPEPHDYGRFTQEGLLRLFSEAGFSETKIDGIGERFSAFAHVMHPFFIFNTVRLGVFPLALLLDRLIPHKLKSQHRFPLTYFCILKK